MHYASMVVWMPLFGPDGRKIGLAVDPVFVRECIQTELPDEAKLTEQLWRSVRPSEPVMRSNWINFHDGTLLATWFQHPDDSGKWLDIDQDTLSRIVEGDDRYSLVYTYHHASSSLDARKMSGWSSPLLRGLGLPVHECGLMRKGNPSQEIHE